MAVRGQAWRELPAHRHRLLKLHKELWVLGKVRKGKLGLGSVNRRVELQGTQSYVAFRRCHNGNAPLSDEAYSPRLRIMAQTINSKKSFPTHKKVKS